MLPAVQVNLWGVLAATAFAMVVGAFWYSSVMFAKPWMKLIGKTQADLQKGAGQTYLLTALLWLLAAFVTANAVQFVAADNWLQGAAIGFWIWAGFVFPTNLIHALFEGKNKTLMAINLGYTLVAFTGMGLILVLLPN